VWRNSRGLALDSLAYDVYGAMSHTVPYLSEPRKVYVEMARPYTPYFGRRTMWLMFPRGRADAGDRFEFQLEQNGWYECKAPGGGLVWIFRRHGRLVDAEGKPVDPRADTRW
jgi:hypothetical protein